MKMCDETITIFNRRNDEETGNNVYYPTTLSGAGWYATQAETIDPHGGIVTADRTVIRIPEALTANYVSPIAYKASPEGKWTLEGGTVIIKGEATGESWTPATLYQAFADCMTVMGVTDNRKAPNAPHFKVVGA